MAGIKRSIDKLGRIVLPKEYRDTYGFRENSVVEITPVSSDMITIRLLTRNCFFCRSSENLSPYRDVYICRNCLNTLKNRKATHE